MTTMMPDTCTLYIKYKDSTKKNSLKVMNVIEVVQMLVDNNCMLNVC